MKCDGKNIEDLTIRKVALHEVDEVYDLMLRVTKLPSSRYYSPSELEYYKSRIEDYGAIFGVYANEKLIAYSVLDFPGIGSDNFGRSVGIPENELLRVALFAGCIVDPAFRGQGIQIELCRVREKYAILLGCIHLFATIHPENNYSLRNVVHSGFEIVLENQRLEWGIRHIVYKRTCEENGFSGKKATWFEKAGHNPERIR